MKTNKAPKKLYITNDEKRFSDKCHSASTEKYIEDDIEYTSTDVFIEKACEYFRRSLEDTKVIDDYRNILVRGIQASYTSVEEFIEDFKRYMEE